MEGDMMMMEDESEDNSRGRLNKIQYVDNRHWNGISRISWQRSRIEQWQNSQIGHKYRVRCGIISSNL